MDVLAKEVHKRVQKKFPRRPVKAYDIDGVWGVDLADMTAEWTKENDGYRYILVVVDVFTRYAWCIPLRDKSGPTLVNAFTELFKQAVPHMVWADRGSEFYNEKVQALFKKHKIDLYSTYSESKSVMAEVFNRTLKHQMWNYYTAHQTRRWLDFLSEFVSGYNHRRHSGIGMSPAEARTGKHNAELFRRQEDRVDSEEKPKKPKLKVGDPVRLSRLKGTFEQGYLPNWTYQIYYVQEVLPTRPVTYKVRDHLGEVLEGSFYEQELQKSAQSDVYLVEKSVKTRKVKGKTEHLVKWMGYDSKYNTWVPERDFEALAAVEPKKK